MNENRITVCGHDYPLYQCHTLIIGSGAAALNCAYHLANLGIKDVLIVTERLGGGVSNNSGSDKQTYYKLSLFGEGQDSVYDMAQTLFNGGSMHGDIALIEAGLSSQEFYHLVQIGVPFPHNEYGGFVGYKTDHDPKQRATSAGPWTSNQMYQKLLQQVEQQQTSILNGYEVIFLITATQNAEKRVIGAIAIDKNKADAGLDAIVIFQAENIVLGTGGPGGLYQDSVYPKNHLGGTGVALEAGATAVNLTEWQYGLASTKFRWNVSGTYQQVLPRYISTAPDGGDEQEFLNQYFPSYGKMTTDIFLKGYQWPFDPRKVKAYGSSFIDILVYQETILKGRRVYMDFRSNPSWNGSDQNLFSELEPEAFQYLQKSDALFGSPFDRLRKMNPMAIELYAQHGIDLQNEPLEIAVCAQHHNGGLKGNIWWESNLKHLFPIGEVNGSHGVYRPGGSALNSGQVGGYRAAQYIAHRYQTPTLDKEAFVDLGKEALESRLRMIEQGLACVGKTTGLAWEEIRSQLQNRMSRFAAHIRDAAGISAAVREAEEQWNQLNQFNIKLNRPGQLLEFFRNRQLCLTQLAVLKSIAAYLEQNGGCRGSYLVLDPAGNLSLDELNSSWKIRPENEALRNFTLEYVYQKGDHLLQWIPVRPIPTDDYWFENVWKSFVDNEIYK